MALHALTFKHDTLYEGTREGIPIYDGTALAFYDWEFRTDMKWKAAKTEDKARVMSQIVEGLRYDASDIARDLGTDKLLGEDGLTALTEALRKHIFPKNEAEAKILYRQGHKKKGILSRQPSEPMTNYITRRRRWWNHLKMLDSSMELSDNIRGDLMLEAANLSKVEQLLVLTSAQNDRKFESIAKAMLDQHALVHQEERPTKNWTDKDKGFKNQGWPGKIPEGSRSEEFGSMQNSPALLMNV